MSLGPKVPPAPKVPKAPKVPGAAEAGKAAGALKGGGRKAGVRSFLRIFKPLLLLLVLGLAAVLVHFFVPVQVTVAGFGVTLRLYSLILLGVIAGIVVLTVLFRLFNFFLQRRRLKRQARQAEGAETARITEALLARWEVVEGLHKSAGVGLYDMPWYLIVGDPRADTATLLDAAGLAMPDADKVVALTDDPDAIDRWIFTEEAVFIDTTHWGGQPGEDAEEAELDALLHLLAEKRHRCPINGVILAVSAPPLAVADESRRRAAAAAHQHTLRRITDVLQVRGPVYTVVTSMERILGFSEFFGDLKGRDREQIFGWSDPHPPDAGFSPRDVDAALDDLVAGLNAQRFVRGAGAVSAEAANRAAFFPEEMGELKAAVADFVKAIFARSRFEAPLICRGIYFVGGRDLTAPVSVRGGNLVPPAVLETLVGGEELPGLRQPIFIKDLFHRKIFREPGLVGRPPGVSRKNRKIWLASALVLGGLLVLGGGYIWQYYQETVSTVRGIEADLTQARAVLADRGPSEDTFSLCVRLANHKERLGRIGWLRRLLGLGRYESLIRKIGGVHRAVFQETQLARIIETVEYRLVQWEGARPLGASGFLPFAEALAEYARWANGNRLAPSARTIAPFVAFLRFPQDARPPYLRQFEIYLSEGGDGSELVDPSAEEIIQKALGTVRTYLQPTLQAVDGDSEKLTESQWWLKLAVLIKEIHNNYRSLLGIDIPAPVTPADEMATRYGTAVNYLQEVLLQGQYLRRHLEAGQYHRVAWLNPDQIYADLASAVRGMARLESQVDKDRLIVTGDYRQRVANPVRDLLPVVNMLSEYPSETWLGDVLSEPLGPEQQGIAHDFGIGNMVFRLLRRLDEFYQLTRQYGDAWAGWKENTLPDRITADGYRTPPLRQNKFTGLSQKVDYQIRTLRDVVAPKGNDGAAPADGDALPLEGENDQREEEERKMAAASFWRVRDLLDAATGWHKVQHRVKMNYQSLYLKEVYQRGEFRQGIPMVDRWPAIKSIAVFQTGNGVALVDPVDRFLAQWTGDIPADLRSLADAEGEGDVPHYPELAFFENLMKEVATFRKMHMQALRSAGNHFAECVHRMDADPALAWQVLRESSATDDPTNQPVSWKRLLSFSGFKKAVEIQSGPIGQRITEQLVDIESHVFQVYRSALLDAHQRMLTRLIGKYQGMDMGDRFPFRVDGPQVEGTMLLRMLGEITSLQKRFELDAGPAVAGAAGAEAEPAPLSRISREIIGEMTRGGMRDFYQDFTRFGAYLYEGRQPRTHAVKASVIPGQVGTYFHWIRLVFGNGDRADLNVYGDPVVDLSLTPENGSVTLHGLDAARVPQASVVVAEGDLSFLQMLYRFGEPTDPGRTTWETEIEVPMSVNPAFGVRAELKWRFEEGLPPLPNWEDFAGGLSP